MSKIILPESFPNLPSAMQKIQNMFAQKEIDILTLSSLLEKEPLISANILRLVNSPHYGLRQNVSSISTAVALLGATIIRGIAMATILKKSFPIDLSPYKISIEQFDKICILRVRLLKEWLGDENIDIQTLSSTAFLMEGGKIILSHEIIKNGFLNSFEEMQKSLTIIETEEQLFGLCSYKIAALLFERWNFEPTFTDMLSGIFEAQTQEQKILHVLATAISVEAMLNEKSIADALALANDYNLNTEKLEDAMSIIQK